MAKHDIDPVLQQLAQAINESGQATAPITLREAVELVVSRINGEHAEVGSAPVLTHGRQLRLAATVC
jgi:hypothetical protein